MRLHGFSVDLRVNLQARENTQAVQLLRIKESDPERTSGRLIDRSSPVAIVALVAFPANLAGAIAMLAFAFVIVVMPFLRGIHP